MHQALRILELLELTFSHLDWKSNVNNAQVCKQWTTIALDLSWTEVDCVGRLFNMLAPIGKIDTKSYEFTRMLVPDDWARTVRRRRCVKLLHVRVQAKDYSKCFSVASRTRTSLDILPNLRTIEWPNTCNSVILWSPLFMHDNVQEFKCCILSEPHDITAYFLHVSRMPQLKELSISPCSNLQGCDPIHLVSLFCGLPELRSIEIPLSYLTPRVCKGIGRLENLCDLRVGDDGVDEVTELSTTRALFPSLKTLTFTILFERFPRTACLYPITLTTLILQTTSKNTEPISSVGSILAFVSRQCRSIQHLDLRLIPETVAMENLDSEEYEDDNLTPFQHLRPVFDLPHLTTFKVNDLFSWEFTMKDMEKIAKSCRSIEVLVLNCDPVPVDDHQLPLQVLLPFARHCPKLQRLGLSLKASVPDLPIDAPPFQNLRELVLGTSNISANEEYDAVQFLRQLLPSHCHLEANVSWPKKFASKHPLRTEVERRRQSWYAVDRMLHLPMMQRGTNW